MKSTTAANPSKLILRWYSFGFWKFAFWLFVQWYEVQQSEALTVFTVSPPPGEMYGDAPNSSVCRAALGNASNGRAKCEIAMWFRGCQFDSGFFQYMLFQYCTFDERILPTVFMVLWLIVLLGAFATIADSFFSPSLIALARTLRMSQNLAGVTLLAFGNGAPDVFSAVTAITTGDPDAPDEGLGLGFLLGSGLLVSTVTAGLVIASTPFRMSRRPFLKDSIFYLAAVAWSASILIRRRIYYADAIGFLVMYILYVFITWAGGTVHRRQMKSTKQYGSGQFWPSSIQWIIDILTSCCSAVYMHCLQNCEFPLYPHLFQRQTTGDTEVQATVKVAYSRSVADAATTKMSDLETCIANGAVVYAKYNPNEFIPSADLPTPVIRVTSTQSPEHAEGDKFMGGSYLPANDTENTITPVPLGTESTYAIHLLTPADHPRMRSSSLRSTDEMPNTRRLSTGAAFNRGPCQRSQSAHRRRASARLSTVGYDLPYMVRWIIANRGMEEKDLSSATGWRRSQRSVHLDLEGGSSPFAQDQKASISGSVKPSRVCSAMASPTLRSSPSPSDVSLDEGASVQAKKITIDLEAKEVQPGVLELPSEDIPVIDRVNEGVAGDRSWLAAWASKGVWHHFIYCMIPVDVESWAEVSVLSKTIQLLQVPIFLIFRITIPTVLENFSDELPGVGLTDEHCDKLKEKRPMETVVEETESETSTPTKKESPCFNETAHTQLDLEAMHGWCKPLNVIQCAIVPTLWALLLTANGGSVGLSSIGNSSVPIFAPFLLVGLILALVVYLTSKWNEPPRLYHRPFFATLGFVTSIIWIYALAHELVNSLETLGIVWEISEAILGLSIMALASSIGDIMANCLLARNGYPRIAYSACIGSPLFNLLLGAGLSYTIKISRGGDGYASLSFTLTQAVLFSCLMAVLASNIAVALVMKFHFHRLYGILLILVYIAFVTVAILIEMDIIVSPKKWGLATGTE